MRSIWVRAEYIRIYDFLVDFYNKNPSDLFMMSPVAVLTGQPVIGKSVWLYYALRRCLAEKRPVIWCWRNSPYMFIEEGVYKMAPDFHDSQYERVVWTLIDSDQSKDGIPNEYIGRDIPFFVISAIFPAKERWSRLHTSYTLTVVVMDPWTRGEIYRAASLLPTTSPNRDIVDDTYDRFGPTPRLCLQMASESQPPNFENYKTAVRKSVEQVVTLQDLTKLTNDLEDLKMDAFAKKR